MSERLRQMERAKNFRETRERVSEMAFAVANASLRLAEQNLAYAVEAEAAAAAEAVRAIDDGPRSNTFISAAIRKAFGFDRSRFEKVRAQREEGAHQAQAILRERRLESEQAVTLHKNLRTEFLAEAAKREQAEVVERFIARSHWSSGKVRVRKLTEAAMV
jgi:hypothetical protein